MLSTETRVTAYRIFVWLYVALIVPSYILHSMVMKHYYAQQGVTWTVMDMAYCAFLAVLWPLSIPGVLLMFFTVWASVTPGF